MYLTAEPCFLTMTRDWSATTCAFVMIPFGRDELFWYRRNRCLFVSTLWEKGGKKKKKKKKVVGRARVQRVPCCSTVPHCRNPRKSTFSYFLPQTTCAPGVSLLTLASDCKARPSSITLRFLRPRQEVVWRRHRGVHLDHRIKDSAHKVIVLEAPWYRQLIGNVVRRITLLR